MHVFFMMTAKYAVVFALSGVENAEPAAEPANLENSIGMTFVLVPAGEFLMGRPDQGDTAKFTDYLVNAPAHPVQISRPFYLGQCEVTQAQYRRVTGENPSWHNSQGRIDSDPYRTIHASWHAKNPTWKGGSAIGVAFDEAIFPVEQVTWHMASQFCERLSRLGAEKTSRRQYRLPSEAEWEYACRGGSADSYNFTYSRLPQDTSGDNAGKLVTDAIPILPVGQFPANRFGLFDMRGNVWEWCADWYGRDYYAASPRIDPKGPESGTVRVVRGSDFRFVGERCKAGFSPVNPARTNRFIGFRVVLEKDF